MARKMPASRLEADPELSAELEWAREHMVRRVKAGRRERLAREAEERRRAQAREARRARLRRLTFGLLGR